MPTFSIWDYVWVIGLWLLLVGLTVYLNRKRLKKFSKKKKYQITYDSEAAGNEDDVTGGEW
jgi:membrane protein implicated in regulation of membrane protease activity